MMWTFNTSCKNKNGNGGDRGKDNVRHYYSPRPGGFSGHGGSGLGDGV